MVSQKRRGLLFQHAAGTLEFDNHSFGPLRYLLVVNCFRLGGDFWFFTVDGQLNVQTRFRGSYYIIDENQNTIGLSSPPNS